MNIREFKRFSDTLDEFMWYGRAFLQSEMGMNWSNIPGRSYQTTPWMEFFTGINNGTYEKLAETITDKSYLSHFKAEVEKRLAPLLDELKPTKASTGTQKIPVHIDIEKFSRYEGALKKMSADKIIFDIIQDDEDIRGTYYIDADQAHIRSYLMLGIQAVLDCYASADRKRILELEGTLKKLDQEIINLQLLTKEKQGEIDRLDEQNRKLEEKLSKVTCEEPIIEDGEELGNNKFRMYFLYKLGFLDNSIWEERTTYEQRATMLFKVLNGAPITTDTALRYYKLFNAIGSMGLKEYEGKYEGKLLDIFRRICPELKFESGKPINHIKRWINP